MGRFCDSPTCLAEGAYDVSWKSDDKTMRPVVFCWAHVLEAVYRDGQAVKVRRL